MTELYKTRFPGRTVWCRKDTDLWHKEDGPAVEWDSGTKEWYQNGLCHRVDGPAVEDIVGNKFWYQNGQRHREDGPAIEYENGNKYYYLNDECYPNIKTNEEWVIFQIIN